MVPRPARGLYLAAGLAFVALGLAGAVLPLLPTTPFLILALWAFSRSSTRLHGWLWSHPRFGPRLRAWSEHRVIPAPVKVTALGAMAASLAWVVLAARLPWPWVTAMAAVVLWGAIFIVRCPGAPPGADG